MTLTNDRHSAAGTYHQLGRVAEEQRRFAEAEDAYKKALEIYVEFDDTHLNVSSCAALPGCGEKRVQRAFRAQLQRSSADWRGRGRKGQDFLIASLGEERAASLPS
jgi:hypothetical protein